MTAPKTPEEWAILLYSSTRTPDIAAMVKQIQAQARGAALEEAAAVCEDHWEIWHNAGCMADAAAAALIVREQIRALMEKKK